MQEIGSGHLVIIGGSRAAYYVATTVRNTNKSCKITIISRDPYHYYDRRKLYNVALGKQEVEDILLQSPDYYKKNNINFLTGKRAIMVDRSKGLVNISTSEKIPFDKLVIASGSIPTNLDVIGTGLYGVFRLYSAHDAISIFRYTREQKVRNLIIVGGGPLGVEASFHFSSHFERTFLIHKKPYLLDKKVDRTSSKLIKKRLEEKGVVVFGPDEPVEFGGHEKKISKVILKNGQHLPADMVLLATGTDPNVGYLDKSILSDNNTLMVNESLVTSDSDIMACGDCANISATNTHGWDTASITGMTAGNVLLGKKIFVNDQISNCPFILKVPGISLTSIGFESKQFDKSFERQTAEDARWWKIYVKEEKPVAGVFINSNQISNSFVTVMTRGQNMPEFIDSIKRFME